MDSDVFRLDGELALVTGGGTGIGLAIARCFVASGARVVLVGRHEDTLRRACEGLGAMATFRVHDVTERRTADTLIDGIEREVGPLSILVNNAGTHLKKSALETTAEEFDAVLQTHVIGAHNLTRASLPGMIDRRHGNVLFIASMASFLGIPLVMAYSAAKTAYLGMVRTLAAETSSLGVRVNAVAPGWIDTPMLERTVQHDEARRKNILGRTPMHHFGAPDDVGWAATYLCSKAAKFVTGVILPVDGGASIGF
jgi:gluconate 5-dehydrogenase